MKRMRMGWGAFGVLIVTLALAIVTMASPAGASTTHSRAVDVTRVPAGVTIPPASCHWQPEVGR
jgi:hypothetical protein